MGSSAKTAEETVDYLRQQGEKAGAFMDLKNPKKHVLKTIQPPCFCLENVSYKTIN
jgi:hypothetical protein